MLFVSSGAIVDSSPADAVMVRPALQPSAEQAAGRPGQDAGQGSGEAAGAEPGAAAATGGELQQAEAGTSLHPQVSEGAQVRMEQEGKEEGEEVSAAAGLGLGAPASSAGPGAGMASGVEGLWEALERRFQAAGPASQEDVEPKADEEEEEEGGGGAEEQEGQEEAAQAGRAHRHHHHKHHEHGQGHSLEGSADAAGPIQAAARHTHGSSSLGEVEAGLSSHEEGEEKAEQQEQEEPEVWPEEEAHTGLGYVSRGGITYARGGFSLGLGAEAGLGYDLSEPAAAAEEEDEEGGSGGKRREQEEDDEFLRRLMSPNFVNPKGTGRQHLGGHGRGQSGSGSGVGGGSGGGLYGSSPRWVGSSGGRTGHKSKGAVQQYIMEAVLRHELPASPGAMGYDFGSPPSHFGVNMTKKKAKVGPSTEYWVKGLLGASGKGPWALHTWM